ncbi:hypothetical protein HHK36_026586 [Tetracentron sinense]|uniref:Uncharacterized protein n=1 Tax=Tetracentron sinense TaxID=13715 RepID=A0A834YGA6_TETSI|nr:hypothetical protein HHK36_026586 [Tetracentron sinense]
MLCATPFLISTPGQRFGKGSTLPNLFWASWELLEGSVQIILVSMVCTLGKGRMAAMVRLLATGNFSDSAAEEASYEKLAAQSVHRELREADEPNLLEEEERCRSLNFTGETGLELDGGTGHKKPPRKGRKKLQTAQDRNSASTERASVMDDSGVSPGSTNYSADVMSPSRKRTTLIAAENLLLSDDLETACGVTKNTGISCQEALTWGKFHKGSIAGREMPFDYVVGCQKPGLVLEHSLSTKDVPVPLATKMYHSQRNHRLRSALRHLYYDALTKEHYSESLSPNVLQGNVMTQASSPKKLFHEQMDDQHEKKKDAYTLPAVQKPDQILAQGSELCLGNSGGYPSAMNFSNQFRDNNFLRSALSVDIAPTGMMRSRYLPTTYSFPTNSGSLLTIFALVSFSELFLPFQSGNLTLIVSIN